MVKETTDDATIDFIPYEWPTYLVLHLYGKKKSQIYKL